MSISFIVACKKYFGQNDKTTAQFIGEVKKLTVEDRKEMTPMLSDELHEMVTD